MNKSLGWFAISLMMLSFIGSIFTIKGNEIEFLKMASIYMIAAAICFK